MSSYDAICSPVLFLLTALALLLFFWHVLLHVRLQLRERQRLAAKLEAAQQAMQRKERASLNAGATVTAGASTGSAQPKRAAASTHARDVAEDDDDHDHEAAASAGDVELAERGAASAQNDEGPETESKSPAAGSKQQSKDGAKRKHQTAASLVSSPLQRSLSGKVAAAAPPAASSPSKRKLIAEDHEAED